MYRKFGYVESGRRKEYYNDNGEDAIMMTLESLERWAESVETRSEG
jgi:ribosomal protein S18 acetylase RimI-like enzyme